MFTLCTLNFVYSVFHVIFLPIPCLHNVVLCLLCVPLATSVYSILSFMLYFLPFLCSHCIYSFTVFTLCTHSCITRAYQYQSISINQSITHARTHARTHTRTHTRTKYRNTIIIVSNSSYNLPPVLGIYKK